MTGTSIYADAVAGGNNPLQDTSTLQGFGTASNPLLRVMNQETVTDIAVLSDAQVGTFLRRKGLVGGNVATIINASLDYFLGDKEQQLTSLTSAAHTSTKRNFIPIIIKTDFKFALNKTDKTKQNVYIIFDSTPDDISFTKNANWASKDFLGRPDPIYTYQHSSATTFTLTGKFFADSFESHGRLLKVSDYIMSLVTPSMNNFMPSPITVFIGEWKTLRCLVNNVTVKYAGPWNLRVTQDDVDAAKVEAQGSTANNSYSANNPFDVSKSSLVSTRAKTLDQSNRIPTHAPHIFEATFSFTIVNQDNNVKYAEQVIGSAGTNPDKITKAELDNSTLLAEASSGNFSESSNNQDSAFAKYETGLYRVSTDTKYTFLNGQLSSVIDTGLRYTNAAETLNIYEDANSVRRQADLGIISQATSNQMVEIVNRTDVNAALKRVTAPLTATLPNPLNLPGSSLINSLNPFKKLI